MKGTFEKRAHFDIKGFRKKGFRGYPPMFHTHGELIYVVEGSIPMLIDGQEHVLKKGELCLLFPYLVHSYEGVKDAETIVILFDPDAIAFDNTMLNKKPICHYADGQQFYYMLNRIIELIKIDRKKTATGYLNAVIGELLDIMELREREAFSQDIIMKILEYCNTHFTEDISVKSVSDALYISQSYVSKVFANKLKYGFREYINSLRIDKAKSLLRDTDKKILDIMLECGFKNQSGFNRTFRNMCRVSPYEYRKQKSK